MRYKEMIQVQTSLRELEYLNEGLNTNGLIGNSILLGSQLAKIIKLLMKKDYKKVKEELKKASKEDILRILLKLDKVTLNLISNFIDIIDGLTGWDLEEFLTNNKTINNENTKKFIGKLPTKLKGEFTDLISKLECKVNMNKL